MSDPCSECQEYRQIARQADEYAQQAAKQLAAERAARQAAEDARDDAQTTTNRWYAEAEGLRQQIAALRDWIRQQARIRRPDGASCWCTPADVAAHYPDHGYRCSQARALLETPAADQQED